MTAPPNAAFQIEPLSYESIWVTAWYILPASVVVEFTIVTLFAINIDVTIILPQPRATAKQPLFMHVL